MENVPKRHVLQEEMECGRYGKKSVLFTKEIDTDCIWLQDTQWSVIKAEVSSRGLGLGVRETRGDTLRTATTNSTQGGSFRLAQSPEDKSRKHLSVPLAFTRCFYIVSL